MKWLMKLGMVFLALLAFQIWVHIFYFLTRVLLSFDTRLQFLEQTAEKSPKNDTDK